MDYAAKGSAALTAKRFDEAIDLYNQAISINPQAVDYYIKRSTAYTRISPPDHHAAYKDSEIALALAFKRAKRELIAQAQLRRGIALFGLEQWADAEQCFEWVKKLDEKEKSISIWNVKAIAKLEELDDEDDVRSQVTIQEKPEVELPTQKAEKRVVREEKTDGTDGVGDATPATTSTTAPPAPLPEGVQTPASKIRHEWYNQPDSISVTLFAKGIPKDKATVDIKPNSLRMSFPLPTESDFEFSLDPLFGDIDPATSCCKIMSTKVEFTLKKVTPGRWASLEGSGPVNTGDDATKGDSNAAKPVVLADKPSNSGPAYPTSSKSGPKNWDKVANELTKKSPKEKKGGENDEAEEETGGIDDDDEGGDPANAFFKHLYKGASDDTKRAMMKSYQESNGTALSTNWEEVGKNKVETTPPDGMEARKYEY